MNLSSPVSRRQLRQRLLAWFQRAHRHLPWRRDRNPYRIWISEIMLQQTQVATVIPYFERFLAAFPTVADLAAASEQDVLKMWEGLGYYRRARNLHCAAQLIVSEHGGQIPREPEALRRLPGIGRYMLGAILSQAFECRLPILEANSQRLLCRLLGVRDDPRAGAARNQLWQAAEDLLPTRRIGEFNQALMELGALVCTAGKPNCRACPLTRLCRAHQLGIQDQIPPPTRQPDPVHVHEAAVIVRRDEHILLVRRPSEGRWAGLWEFPHAPVQAQEPYEEAAERLLRELTGVEAQIGAELLTLRHSVTHHHITLVCLDASYQRGRFRSTFYPQCKWLKPADVARYPVSAPQRRLARAVIEPLQQRRLF
jgi:A/G-specific adenine glycosylase